MGVSVDATNWANYKTGLFSNCDESHINHDTFLVGATTTYWKIKNSWGTSWGDQGFGIVSKDSDCALSAYSFYYTSDAVAGANLVYNNKLDLNTKSNTKNGYFIIPSLFLIVILALIN